MWVWRSCRGRRKVTKLFSIGNGKMEENSAKGKKNILENYKKEKVSNFDAV